MLLLLFFLAISLLNWIFLIVLLFNPQADGFLINSKNERILYEIAVIATTITFGFFTIQFSIRALSNSANEKRLLLLKETNKILKSYMELVSGPECRYARQVCLHIVRSFNMKNLFSNFENTKETFKQLIIDLIANSNKSIANEIINSAKASINISTGDGSYPEWFPKATNSQIFDYFVCCFIAVENQFEALSYHYVNKTIDENVFEDQFLIDVRFFYLMHLVFESLEIVENPCKSISYQAVKKYSEKQCKSNKEV